MISGNPPLATLHELSTIYGCEDLVDFLEVMAVNAYNLRKLTERNR